MKIKRIAMIFLITGIIVSLILPNSVFAVHNPKHELDAIKVLIDELTLLVEQVLTSPMGTQLTTQQKLTIPVVITMCDAGKCFQGFGTIRRAIVQTSIPSTRFTFTTDSLEAEVIVIVGSSSQVSTDCSEPSAKLHFFLFQITFDTNCKLHLL